MGEKISCLEEGYKSLGALVPEYQLYAFQAVHHCHAAEAGQLGVIRLRAQRFIVGASTNVFLRTGAAHRTAERRPRRRVARSASARSEKVQARSLKSTKPREPLSQRGRHGENPGPGSPGPRMRAASACDTTTGNNQRAEKCACITDVMAFRRSNKDDTFRLASVSEDGRASLSCISLDRID